jgi:hypothetical protein
MAIFFSFKPVQTRVIRRDPVPQGFILQLYFSLYLTLV